MKNLSSTLRYRLGLGAILLITALTFSPCLSNGFTNWDDHEYVVHNPHIRSLSSAGIKDIFTAVVIKNWHPFTLLSYAIEYRLFGLNPFYFHLTNFLLHLINTALVFIFLYMLTRSPGMAFLCGLLFGIHPLHVESVAWIAERKDMLFSTFYLGSLIAYVHSLSGQKHKLSRLLSILLFIFSGLSKATAITLPVILLIIDYLRGHLLNKKTLIEKIPFLTVSFIFGIMIVKTHADVLALRSDFLYDPTGFERVLFSGYAFCLYLAKMVLPLNLSAMYPYPEKINGLYPFVYYCAPVIAIVLMSGVWYMRKRANLLTFGMLFFIVTITLNLPFSMIGRAIIAERYVYIPSIGVFIMGALFTRYLLRKPHIRRPIIIGISIYLTFLAVLSFKQCQVWNNSITLWSQVIRHHPQLGFAYYNRADAYIEEKSYDKAITDFNHALEFGPVYIALNVLSGRGQAFAMQGNYSQAIDDFSTVLTYNPNEKRALLNRGWAHFALKHYDKAHEDFTRLITQAAEMPDGFIGRGRTAMGTGDYPQAIDDLSTAIEKGATGSDIYFFLGQVYYFTEQYSQALICFDLSLTDDPANARTRYNRALVLLGLKDYHTALREANTLIGTHPSIKGFYELRASIYHALGDENKAGLDILKAQYLAS